MALRASALVLLLFTICSLSGQTARAQQPQAKPDGTVELRIPIEVWDPKSTSTELVTHWVGWPSAITFSECTGSYICIGTYETRLLSQEPFKDPSRIHFTACEMQRGTGNMADLLACPTPDVCHAHELKPMSEAGVAPLDVSKLTDPSPEARKEWVKAFSFEPKHCANRPLCGGTIHKANQPLDFSWALCSRKVTSPSDKPSCDEATACEQADIAGATVHDDAVVMSDVGGPTNGGVPTVVQRPEKAK
jgi:hypothetical protein